VRSSGQSDIYIKEIGGGKARNLTQTKDWNEIIPHWSQDGKYLYFGSKETGIFQIWKAPSDGSSDPIQVTKNGGWAGWESSDGKWLFIFKEDRTWWQMPVEGGEETELDRQTRASFRETEIGIFQVETTGTNNFLEFFNFETDEVTNVVELGSGIIGGTQLSPDRNWILFTKRNNEGDIKVIENFK
jgi:Tol biopolymer transport system component